MDDRYRYKQCLKKLDDPRLKPFLLQFVDEDTANKSLEADREYYKRKLHQIRTSHDDEIDVETSRASSGQIECGMNEDDQDLDMNDNFSNDSTSNAVHGSEGGTNVCLTTKRKKETEKIVGPSDDSIFGKCSNETTDDREFSDDKEESDSDDTSAHGGSSDDGLTGDGYRTDDSNCATESEDDMNSASLRRPNKRMSSAEIHTIVGARPHLNEHRLNNTNSIDGEEKNGVTADKLQLQEESEGSNDSNICFDSADSEDLDKAEIEREKDKVTKSKLSKLTIAMQGFQSKATTHQDDEETEKETNLLNNISRGMKDGPTSVNFKGRSFSCRQCYQYKEGSTTAIVGVVQFLPDNKVGCVLVVPFRDTFLGQYDEEDENTASKTYDAPPYVTVRGPVYILSLANFGRRCVRHQLERIPDLMYEPQSVGSWHSFCYQLDPRRMKRRGRRRSPPRVLELFAGSGGMSMGFAKEGFTIVKAVEKDRSAAETYSANHSNAAVLRDDVHDFLKRCRGRRNNVHRKRLGRITHIHASPPCQGCSSANRTGAPSDKANNDLSLSFVEAVRIFKPDTATFENVMGMWRRKHVGYLKTLIDQLLAAGYQVRCCRLKACDYGDPQCRPRLVLFAARRHVPLPSPPVKTHGEGNYQLPFVTVKDVLEELIEDVDGEEEEDVIPPNSTDEEESESSLPRLHPDRFAPTIRTTNFPFHYSKKRRLYVHEAAALQSYPPWYKFFGTLKEQRRQIGNSVPIELACAIARTVKLSLNFLYSKDEEEEEEE